MARGKPENAENEKPLDLTVSQGEATKPVTRDNAGRALDQWGLPMNGPARAARLAELGMADPAVPTEIEQAPPVLDPPATQTGE